MKKSISLLMAAALLTGILSGCGGGTSGQTATEAAAGGTGAPKTGASGDAVTIKFVNGFTGGDGGFMTKIVDGFNESQSDYFVDMLITDDHYTKFKSDKFDMVIMHADWLSTYIPDGLIRPVDDLYEKAGLSIDDWAEVTKSYAQVDGKRNRPERIGEPFRKIIHRRIYGWGQRLCHCVKPVLHLPEENSEPEQITDRDSQAACQIPFQQQVLFLAQQRSKQDEIQKKGLYHGESMAVDAADAAQGKQYPLSSRGTAQNITGK